MSGPFQKLGVRHRPVPAVRNVVGRDGACSHLQARRGATRRDGDCEKTITQFFFECTYFGKNRILELPRMLSDPGHPKWIATRVLPQRDDETIGDRV